MFHLRWSTITSNYRKSMVVIESLCLFMTCLRLLSQILLSFFCSTPRVALLVVDLSPSFRLNFSCFVFLNHSIHCKVVSVSSLNTLTFVVPVFVSFSPVWQQNLLLPMFHSLKLLSISTFFSSLSIRFLSCCFLSFCYCFPRCYQYPTFTCKKGPCTVHIYKYIYTRNACMQQPLAQGNDMRMQIFSFSP